MSEYGDTDSHEGDDGGDVDNSGDAAFAERWGRWEARHRDRGAVAPVPMWWPWPLECAVICDGDPDTGLVVVGLEPLVRAGETYEDAGRPDAKLVRQPAGEPPYRYGWPGLAWRTPQEIRADAAGDDPPAPVFAHAWGTGRWRWTVFTSGTRDLTPAELDRVRTSLDPAYRFPPGVTEHRPWD